MAAAIKAARTATGLTQDDLSDRANLAYSTLAKIEQGAIKNPSVFTIAAIAEALGTSVDSLIRAGRHSASTAPTKASVKFVYCDVNGVLVRFYHHAFVTISEETGVPFDRVETAFWHFNDAANRGKMTIEEFGRALGGSLGVGVVDWRRHYLLAIEPIHLMHTELKRLAKNYRVGLLTNSIAGMVDELFKRKLIPKLAYAAIVDSSQVGTMKPEPKIYELAERIAGVSGGEIFFIDDSRANLTAAEKFGWRGFWFNDYDPEDSVKRIAQILT